MAKSISINNPMDEEAVAKGRISFPNLTEFSTYNGESQGVYKVSLILDKTKHEELIARLKGVTGAYRKSAGKKITNIPIKDGDKLNAEREDEGEEPRDEYKNAVIITMSSKGGFSVFDGKKQAMQDPAKIKALFYAGAYANAFISSSCFENEYGVTMSLTLNGIMFAGDGEPFGEVAKTTDKKAFDDFEDVEGGNTTSNASTSSEEEEEDDEF